MFRPGMVREQWTILKPKVRELWPNLTEQDVQAINGDGELLVIKVREKYGIVREEIFNKLAPYLANGMATEGWRQPNGLPF